jgi:hypothetical protein
MIDMHSKIMEKGRLDLSHEGEIMPEVILE